MSDITIEELSYLDSEVEADNEYDSNCVSLLMDLE